MLSIYPLQLWTEAVACPTPSHPVLRTFPWHFSWKFKIFLTKLIQLFLSSVTSVILITMVFVLNYISVYIFFFLIYEINVFMLRWKLCWGKDLPCWLGHLWHWTVSFKNLMKFWICLNSFWKRYSFDDYLN